MRFHITTLGCPKNTVDSEMMATLLQQAGHALVANPKRADLHIINTCGFIADARDESYAALVQAAQHKRRSQILVAAGCMAQRYGEEIQKQVPGVDAVIGTRSWPEIVELVSRLESGSTAQVFVSERSDLIASIERKATMGATAYLKIADGCDASCAFCAIPLIKGRQQSKPKAEIIREAQELEAQGVREVILIAQDTTAYGHDLGQTDALPGLLYDLAEHVPELDWIRILYAYPQRVTMDLARAMADIPQVCQYLDLPLQHGHPDVLRRMRRPHDVEAVYTSIDALRGMMPEMALRSTFIVGFPGETEAEFQGLLDLMRAISFDKVGVFAYSAEDGTAAAEMPGRVEAQVIAERYDRAMILQQEISYERNEAQLERELPILIDGAGDGISIGRTYREAPEIDGMVIMPAELPVGEFILGRIVEAQEYDLVALPV